MRHKIRIGLTRNGIAVLRSQGGWRSQTTVVADYLLADDVASAPERLANACRDILNGAQCGGSAVETVLADQLVRLFMVTPPQNVNSPQDCRAAAAMRFQNLYGEPIGGWLLQADWDARHPFLACAIPSQLIACLTSAVQESGCHLLSLTPHFIATWNRWNSSLKDGAWFGVIHDEILNLAAINDKRLQAIRSVPIPVAGITPIWFHEHVTREALRLNLNTPSSVQLCGNACGEAIGPSIKKDLISYSNLESPHLILPDDAVSAALALIHRKTAIPA